MYKECFCCYGTGDSVTKKKKKKSTPTFYAYFERNSERTKHVFGVTGNGKQCDKKSYCKATSTE